MAEAAASARSCVGYGGGGGCFLRRRLLAAAAYLAAVGLAAAALGATAANDAAEGRVHVTLTVADVLAASSSSSCDGATPLPREHKRGAGSGTRMTIVHRHGPCSPLADAHGNPPTDEERRCEWRAARVAVIVHPVAPGVVWARAGHGNYVVTIGLGTPASQYTVVFDTGSDTTWVQCRPCVVVCYKQKDRLFDPAKSSTYSNISCASSYCSDLYIHGCAGGHCLYDVQYGDGSYTVGFFAQDTLTLSSDSIKVTVILQLLTLNDGCT
ncbi:hypothetical protein GUJ93_ZPchr0012g21728 [Zizania palustris]|uniref:Peptidase A1 domain-containing protein n=1 Tax=Zizania palustris TaxID=103762 RepID=A0A8J5WQX6_ZIZPA|nr:hypothetical protein GUJ93_ZPchr0012g21728 [Zizania palustris]